MRGEGQPQGERLGVGSTGIPFCAAPWGKEQAERGDGPAITQASKAAADPSLGSVLQPLCPQLRAHQGQAHEPGFPKRGIPTLTPRSCGCSRTRKDSPGQICFTKRPERQVEEGPATSKAIRPVLVSGFKRTVVANVG